MAKDKLSSRATPQPLVKQKSHYSSDATFDTLSSSVLEVITGWDYLGGSPSSSRKVQAWGVYS
ncbi:hypothetical protein PROFUN_01177 [Planoprotostelium fungivorum]|uniref:Uncharacterized protein n=1 Tax=Planoprotostelium fungivorum TaxID=1890364 RepID=A0A2P6NCK3_9EUKA|nr:hypothetical protein PROFUN_01177 [Planoprotostelium fungivorum]